MDLLTVEETATLLKVNPETVRRHIAVGRLPAVRVGRHIRIRREELEQFMAPVAPRKSAGSLTATEILKHVPPLSPDEIARRRRMIEESARTLEEMRIRHGGNLPPSWPLVREERIKRSAEL